MILNIEFLQSGGYCRISDRDMQDVEKYEFRVIDFERGCNIMIRSSNNETFREKGFRKLYVAKPRGQFSAERYTVNKYVAITKFMVRRWMK